MVQKELVDKARLERSGVHDWEKHLGRGATDEVVLGAYERFGLFDVSPPSGGVVVGEVAARRSQDWLQRQAPAWGIGNGPEPWLSSLPPGDGPTVGRVLDSTGSSIIPTARIF